MAADWVEKRGPWRAWGNGPGEALVLDEVSASHGDEGMFLGSRQDCDDLIELLRVVRERLP